MSRARASAPLLLLWTGALVGACRQNTVHPIATLIENSGAVEGETGTAPWRAVSIGAGFRLGDAVRTGPGSSARLRFSAGGTIRMSENSLVRFRQGAPTPELSDRGGPEVSIELGKAEIVEAVDLSVSSPAGRMRVDRGGRVRIDAEPKKVLLEVVLGRAIVTGSAGTLALDAGHGVSFQIGGAILERYDLKVGEATLEHIDPTIEPMAPPPAPPEAPPAPVAVEAPREEKPPARADVTFNAGDSVIIHNDKMPLAVRLKFDQLCSGEARVELGRSTSSRSRGPLLGSGSVVLRLRSGRVPYRVQCVGDGGDSADGRVQGVLSLKRDSGNAPLARHPPSNTIEADGRRYTVLFQSRPPVLTLSWAAPAGAADLELHVDSGGQTHTIETPGPTYRFASGALAEGTHTWWYADKDGHESPHTTLTIRFDNTAPTAQFFRGTVIEGPEGAITVDGVAVQGSRVSAAGQSLAVDDHGRFRAAVLPLAGDDAVAVQVESPHGGSHVYIRRRSATP
ncbi:MAG TPA: FecR family protein [Polyangia bacterium]|nr:FecR family protein [Polyangia bacterium]